MSPSRSAASGPPCAASGATWPTISPCVAPEKRPSVTSATASPRPFADDRRRDVQHLAHPGAAGRALVADHDHVARLDRARLDGGEAVLLGVEDARRAAVDEPLVAGELDDAPSGREVARRIAEAAGRLQRLLERDDDLLARRLLDRRRRSRRACGRRRSARVPVSRSSCFSSSRATSATPPASCMSVAT